MRYSTPFRDQELPNRDGLVGIVRLRSVNSHGSSSLATMIMCTRSSSSSSMRGCSTLHHTFDDQ